MATASAVEFKPGEYDDAILEHLRAMAQAAHLGTMTVRDVAPEFAVANQGDLTWDEALATANLLFGDVQPARASFLRKYLSKGAPESRLLELRWPRPLMIFTSGPNAYGFLEWHGSEQPPKDQILELNTPGGGKTSLVLKDSARNTIEMTPRSGVTTSLLPPPVQRCIARIDIGVASNALTGIPSLSFPDVMVKGLLFDLLSFDENDRLVSSIQHFIPKSGGPNIQFSSSARNDGSAVSYSATVWDVEENSESLEFTPDLVLKARWVQLRGRMSYHEFYEQGRLRERIYTNK